MIFYILKLKQFTDFILEIKKKNWKCHFTKIILINLIKFTKK